MDYVCDSSDLPPVCSHHCSGTRKMILLVQYSSIQNRPYPVVFINYSYKFTNPLTLIP